MLLSLLYFIFAVLGLGFLIFIHELGHYWMARRVGMKVESFGIGFGKPIYSFEHDGVKWNICWLPFGGYVKIAGMEKEKDGKEPHEISNGFFGKSPWARIQVSLMGPLANIVFAFLVFTVLWLAGGREKNFSDVTKKIGWVDPRSELFKNGVRPGDEIVSYNGEPVHGTKDHIQAAMTGGDVISVVGQRFDPASKSFLPFSLQIHPYHPEMAESGLMTTGVFASASYLVYAPHGQGLSSSLPKGSPLEESGLEHGDRIVAIDGERIYSLPELSYILNDGRALLTVRRGKEFLLRRVPRISIEDLKLNHEQNEELTDWQWESKLKDKRLQKLYFIPYNINADCEVEGKLPFFDQDKADNTFAKYTLSEKEEPLQIGDEIVAVDGTPVHSAHELLKGLQGRKVHIIVQPMAPSRSPISAQMADEFFDRDVSREDLKALESSIGTPYALQGKGSLRLLKPITPKTRAELFELQDKSAEFAREIAEEKKQIQAINDPERRAQALKFLEKQEKQYLLGLPGIQDMPVTYNPNPVLMFEEIVDEVTGTLKALVGGYLNPKWLSGPIGIVQVIHQHWGLGIKEALFWMAIISLNLGLLNLLPLPVLDGGYIALSIFEIATGVKLKAKTIEKIIVPFAILLIGFFVFLTYHDLSRLISNFLRLG